MSTLISAMVAEYERLMKRHASFDGVSTNDVGGGWIFRAGCALYSGASELMEAVSATEAKTADDAVIQLAALAANIDDLTQNEHDEHSEMMLIRRVNRLLYSIQGHLVPQSQTAIDCQAVQYLMPAYANPWSDPDTLRAAYDKRMPFEGGDPLKRDEGVPPQDGEGGEAQP